jgi:hypothetical protein
MSEQQLYNAVCQAYSLRASSHTALFSCRGTDGDGGVQVRTSGVRLLFDIITRHGAALKGEEGRVWDMAFPLLMEVAKNAHLSDEAHRLAAGPLGTKSRLV